MLVRRALGDDARNPKYIGLVRGQGYRMLQTVPIVPAKEDAKESSGPAAAHSRLPLLRQLMPGWGGARLATIALAAVALAAASTVLISTDLADKPASVRIDQATIAVLPFSSRDLTDDAGYLATGLHEAVTAMLADQESLQVISGSAVEPYRTGDKPRREITRELGADAMLEGSVLLRDDRLQVDIELFDGRTIETLWSRDFDETLSTETFFAIRTSIANAVAETLRVDVAPREQLSAEPPTSSLEAYLAYLRGIALLRRRTAATLSAAIEHFLDASRKDPDFVLPYIGLADGYQLLAAYSSRSKQELLPQALAAAEKAISMDPENGAAYTSLAMIHFEASREPEYIFDIVEPEPLFLRALRLNPNYATTYQWYGEYLGYTGQYEKAAEMYEQGLELDSGSPILNHVYAVTLIRLGRFEQAEGHFLRAVEIDPGFARAYQGLAVYYFGTLGRVGDAAWPARQAALLNPALASNYALLANIYMHLGDESMAEQWLAEANRLQPASASSIRVSALLNLYQGNVAEAAGIAVSGVQRFPGDYTLRAIAKVGYLLNDRDQAALQLYEREFQWLSEDSPSLTVSSSKLAIDYARLLQKLGQHEESKKLLEAVQQLLSQITFGDRYSLHVLQASVHALNGETRSALDSLRTAIDSGWRRNTFYHFDYDPNFDSIRNDPEFRALAEEVRADLASQRERVQPQGVESTR